MKPYAPSTLTDRDWLGFFLLACDYACPYCEKVQEVAATGGLPCRCSLCGRTALDAETVRTAYALFHLASTLQQRKEAFLRALNSTEHGVLVTFYSEALLAP